MKLGSLFDGIGGWPLAAVKSGVEPVWASEIERFPIEVTKRHFPNLKHVGDITKLNGATLQPVDIITSGSPCQDLSIAGKREGLQGERSGLFMESVRIFREMREATNGKYPRFFVWENVTGAFSSGKGNDFRAVLEEIAETEIPMPKSGRWASAGMVRINKCEIAWRVIDAQYWGVPQRRKRIFLVADFGGQCAGEILFIEEGLRGDSAESRIKGQGVAGNVAFGVGDSSKIAHCLRAGGSKADKHESTAYIVRMRSGYDGGGKGALVSEEKALTLATGNDQTLFQPVIDVWDMTHADEVMRPVTGGVVQTLNARMGTGGNQVPVVSYAMQAIGEYKDCGVASSLKQRDYKDATDLVVYSLQGNMIGRQDHNDPQGNGVNENISFTLNTTDKHVVAYSLCFEPRSQDGVPRIHGEICPTLNTSQGGQRQPCIAQNGYKIRRLTPTECERLQGLPDGWTSGGSDTQRYKALGNGMAQPCPDFVLSQIRQICTKERSHD